MLTTVSVWSVLAALWAVLFQTPGSVTTWGVVATDQRDWVALLSAFDYSPFFAIGIVFYRAWREGWTRWSAALLALAFFVELLLGGFQGLVVTLGFALVVWMALNGWMLFLVNRLTLWLGTISYSLYLTHRNLGYLLLSWLHERSVGAFIAIAVTLLAALALATALTYALERPASTAIRSWYEARRRARKPEAAGAT